MLKTLQIKNYVLIDSLEIDFPAGLIIITGQTGAGKSIILGALSLVMGAKADSSMIGESGDSCVVEAEFEVKDESVRQILDEEDIEWDGGNLVIRRVLNRNGRARGFVNDSPVAANVLSQLSTKLIDIHSQHDTLMLNDRKYQLSILDSFAGDSALLSDCKASWTRLLSLRSELSELTKSLQRLALERDFNEAMFRQLDEAHLDADELDSLEAEQKQLANAEEIKSCLYQAENLISPEDSELQSVDSILKESVKLLEKAGRFIPSADELGKRIESSRLELDDILSEIDSLGSKIEVSQDRLDAVEERMSMLYTLMKKHSCSTVAELIAVRDELSAKLFDSDTLENRKSEIEASIKSEEKNYETLAAKLHKARLKAAAPFSEAIVNSIHFLELDRSTFSVNVDDAPASAEGKDSVSFMFSSTGKSPVEISKCASGGELSRIMLAIKDLMAQYASLPTMIFDEIDTGVSGSVADKMGSMICRMGRSMQVFAITHLPQVAAKGDAHYLVSKAAEGERMISHIERITGNARISEIARMLSGSTITEEAIANARSLLK